MQILKQMTAAILAGAMLLADVQMPVSAANDTDAAMLPSGSTVKALKMELSNLEINAKDAFASAAIGIFQGEDVLDTEYFGETDLAQHTAANEDSVYEWGSISKTLIWVSAMQLREQGKLDLDRDVRDYLPDGFFQHLSYDEPITMLNLMNHNAGWQETFRPLWKADGEPVRTLREELQAVEPAQVHRPGEVTAYSNYGAAVAAYVLECITGQDYGEYVHAHIFAPLGMEHTAIAADHSDNAWVYAQRRKVRSYRFVLANAADLGPCLNTVGIYPAGAATGTLNDLMTYAQALVNDDAPLFQSPETQAELFSGTDFYGDSEIPLCAHGFFFEEHAVRTCGHTGATTAGQANLMLDPESKTGLVIMTNEPDGNVFLSQMPALVFGDLPVDKYSAAQTDAALNGYYLNARSLHRGMARMMPFLTAVNLQNMEQQQLENGVYQVTNGGAAALIGSRRGSDGNAVLQMPAADLIAVRGYLPKLCLLTVYVLLGIAGVYLLRIRHQLKKHGKLTAGSGAAVMTAGHVGWIGSVMLAVLMAVFYGSARGGIPYPAAAGIGAGQMLCAAVCTAAAAASLAALLRTNAHRVRYAANAVCNVLVIAAILFYQLYRFWEI
ncbi:MAG: beta-lactamase family protein [Oscillospiraceae bacterium]|nr:beta-lactamase family protein [Oscillospiraceae bacterium]